MKKFIYPLIICCLVSAHINAQDWHLTGNASTTPGTHFIGTTDSKVLMFKVNNQRSGYIDYAGNKANTSFGYQALKSVTGANNVAVGYKASFSNTAGYSNVALGGGALYKNTVHTNLVAIGDSALYNNGLNADEYQAVKNTAVGSKSLYANTVGYFNTATGFEALHLNTEGYSNVASGYRALYSNNIGYDNTAIGKLALENNTVGILNTAVGSNAGTVPVSSFNCTFIGAEADQSVPIFLTNSTALGYGAAVYASNQVRIGNSTTASIGGFEPWTELSDGRFKKDIKENVKGLEFINKLKPVTYHLKVHELDAFLRPNKKLGAADAQYKAVAQKAIDEKEKVLYTGFVAQDVEKAAKELNYDFHGVDAPDNEHDHYGLRYSVFVVPLVKAVQELSQQNDALRKQNEAQQQLNRELENRLSKLEAMTNAKTTYGQHLQPVILSSAVLLQNAPNPAKSNTVISYTLPADYQSATIVITDNSGKTIREIPLSGAGNGKITANVAALAAGTYQYTLVIDAIAVKTKSMVITK